MCSSPCARLSAASDFASALLMEKLQLHPAYYGEMVWIIMMLEEWLCSHSRVVAPEPLSATADGFE